jgi:calpain-7
VSSTIPPTLFNLLLFNQNIDLHALTGWIPERVDLSDPEEFDADKEFKKIKSRFPNGDCLVTTGTGELTDDEADRAGLVSTHAYAMLNIVEVKGHRLFQLKNPWSTKRLEY